MTDVIQQDSAKYVPPEMAVSALWDEVQFILFFQGENSFRDEFIYLRWSAEMSTWTISLLTGDADLPLIDVVKVRNEFGGKFTVHAFRPGQWQSYLDNLHTRLKIEEAEENAAAARREEERKALAFSAIDDAALFAEQRPVPKAEPEVTPEPEPETAPGIVCVAFESQDKEGAGQATEIIAQRIAEGYRIIGMTGERIVVVLMQRGGQTHD